LLAKTNEFSTPINGKRDAVHLNTFCDVDVFNFPFTGKTTTRPVELEFVLSQIKVLADLFPKLPHLITWTILLPLRFTRASGKFN